MCRVSFVTSVYNCEKYIAETIQSVISQTYTDWEYIIIDDCSTDKSADIIRSFDDGRIRFIQNDSNQGQCKNLNYGISLAKGEYIARLDHDDICYPDRVKEQLELMDNNPNIDLCGSNFDIWKNGKIIHRKAYDINGTGENRLSIEFGLIHIPHSSFFIRRNVFTDKNVKYRKYKYAEDLDLLMQILECGEIDYIKRPLVLYRVFPSQFTQVCGHKLIFDEKFEIKCNHYDKADMPYKDILKKAAHEDITEHDELVLLEKAVVSRAEQLGIVNTENNNCVKNVFQSVCLIQKPRVALYLYYIKSSLYKKGFIFTKDGIIFLIKCILHYTINDSEE